MFVCLFRYTDKNAYNLGVLVTKYQQRNGWSHRDLLRLCHLKSDKDELNIVFRYKIAIVTSSTLSYKGQPLNWDKLFETNVSQLSGVDLMNIFNTEVPLIAILLY